MVRALPPGLLRVAALSIGILSACQAPEAFYKADAGLGVAGKAGIGGGGGSGGGGSGGMIASSGGAGTGGTTGTGGMASGGSSSGGSASGGASTGGRGSGGAGTGGAASGGSGVAGNPASGGSGMAGMAGTGSGGRGSGGVGAGGTGAGGSTGTGPCMGLCGSPLSVPIGMNSGALGTKATCHEVVGTASGVVCGNFASPRTMTINNTAVACTGSGVAIPAKRNGGYCMQATAGDYSYAYFATY